MDKISWLEQHGIENMKQRYATADLMSDLVKYLLTMCITGAGAALLHLAKSNNYVFAALFCGVWLSLVAIYLSIYCLGLRNYPAIYNRPLNLNQDGYEFEQLRMFQLEHLDNACVNAAKLNLERSKSINLAIVSMALTPIITIIIAIFS